MGNTGSIVTAVRWWHRRRGPAPGWIAALLVALLVALLAAAGSGEAVTLNPGDILVTDAGAAALIRLNPIDGKPTGVAQGGYLIDLGGIAIAPDGDVLVVSGQCCGGQGGVIRVNPVDGKQTVVAQAGHFVNPAAIAIAPDGTLFVVDGKCCGRPGGVIPTGGVIRVHPVAGAMGVQTVVASGGEFSGASGIAIAVDGDLFVVNCCGPRVIRVNPVDGTYNTVTPGRLVAPTGIAIAGNGDLLVADPLCCADSGGGVVRWNPNGGIPRVVAQGDQIDRPVAVTSGSNGDLFVADLSCCGGRVIRVNPAVGGQTVVSSEGTFVGPLMGIATVPVPKNPVLIVTNSFGGSVVAVNPVDGSQRGVAAGAPLVSPSGVAIARDGALFVADPGCCDGGTPGDGDRGGVIRVDPADGSQIVVAQGGNFSGTSDFPFGIALAPTGDLFVTSSNCCGVKGEVGVIRVNPADPDLATNQTVVAKGGKLGVPIGIAIARNGDLLVADVEGVILVNPADPNLATNQTVVSTGQHLATPRGIAIAATGDLFVADASCCGGQGGVIRVSPVGSDPNHNQTVFSSGQHFSQPSGIAIDANGDLFVADTGCCGGQGSVIRVNPVDGTQAVVAQGDKLSGAFGIAFTQLLRLDPSRSCGGSVPCACGDRVVRNHTLRGSDPVTRTACSADGLVVAAGVALDLGGATLRGQGSGAGVRIEPGASDVMVRGGRIAGFATGVHGEGTTAVRLSNLLVFDSRQDGVILTGDGHAVEVATIQGNGGIGVAVVGTAARLSRLQVNGNGRAGVRVVGSGHTVSQSTIEGNGEAGAEVAGDANRVLLLQVTGNGADGVSMAGTGNQAARINATRNGGDGLRIEGANATVESNRATSNGGVGLEIHGIGHAVSSNIAGQNTGTGLQMLGTTGSRFDRNRGENNGGFGIADDSTGTGTSGTANTYTQNICGRGNGAGSSSPPGLCR